MSANIIRKFLWISKNNLIRFKPQYQSPIQICVPSVPNSLWCLCSWSKCRCGQPQNLGKSKKFF